MGRGKRFKKKKKKVKNLGSQVCAVPSSIYNYSCTDFLHTEEQLYCLFHIRHSLGDDFKTGTVH